ncbi:MAG TPA: glycosyltransferase family 4 protein [Candidatus Saccharimonadales bacterium]|nr:glycosyltransferase family 4 protein [Candidatus Saccharimonadales bacterium]
MISFVWTPSSFWTPPFPLVEGSGGSESFVLGQARELTRRGIENQVITFRLGKDDGRASAPDVHFVDFEDVQKMGTLHGESVIQTEPLDYASDRTPFVMMHNPPYLDRTKDFYQKGYANRRLMTNSHANARLWAHYFGIPLADIAVVYPFAHAAFTNQPSPVRAPGPIRVLFAGRLTVDKGLYSFFEALHAFVDDAGFEFSVIKAPSREGQFKIIESLVNAHPMLTAIESRHSPQDMAELLTQYDVVVMPSHKVMWPEPFGMLSVEAQHAGCRVVASNVGGLPETDCGGLITFDSDSPVAFAASIREAAAKGRLTDAERKKAANCFTVESSVDQLLAAFSGDFPVYRPTK